MITLAICNRINAISIPLLQLKKILYRTIKCRIYVLSTAVQVPPSIYIYIFKIFIYLFILAALDLSCGIWALSYGMWALNCGMWTQLLHACGIQFSDQGLNPSPLHWELGVLPMDHQGSPQVHFLLTQKSCVYEYSYHYHPFFVHVNSLRDVIYPRVHGQQMSRKDVNPGH